MRVEIIVSSMRIEELAHVVRVIAGRLKPYGKIVLVQPLCNEFGVST
jgi:hypothetical protein